MGYLEVLLGPSWRPLGPFCGCWGHPEPSWYPFGQSWSSLGPSWASLQDLLVEALLVLSLGVLDGYWSRPGPSRRSLGVSSSLILRPEIV